VDSTQKAIADSKDFFEIMEKKPIQDNSNLLKLEISDGEVVFDKVAFGYDDKKVLKDIDFVIKPKTKIALVGESGVGKTTITNLLMKLYAPTKGAILIDGQDISEYDQQSVRNNIGVVFQDPSLFSGTISENIAYANPKSDKKDIIAASKAANADEFIKEFAEGYESQIGEHGIKLSGGQKQRIAIARALLKNPKILILDEATSSLDSKSEILVQRALKELMKDRTTIIIAHRLSTIANVDQIITIKDGNVDEIGTPKELSNSGGIYSQLLALQEGKIEEKEKKLKSFDIDAS
jgi:ATP-binding cassette subfamily B protein